MAENTELATIDVRNALSQTSNGAYSSLKAGTMKEKALFHNATSNPTHKVGDYINKTIRVKDIYVESIMVINEETKKEEPAPRIVLVDTEGKSYQAVSRGVLNALTRLIQNFGEPTWEEGLPLVVKQISLGTRQMLTLDVDVEAL